MIKNASNVEKVPMSTILGKNVCKSAISLINKLLVFNPNKRLTAEEALEHDYVAAFHDPDQEIVLPRDIVIPFNDDVRLSVEDYRNKLYEIMSSNRSIKYSCTKPKSLSPDLQTRIPRNYTIKKEPKSGATQSESRISYGRSTNHNVTTIKSDSRVVTKQNIQFPKAMVATRVHINDNKLQKDGKKRFANVKQHISNINNYNQAHGIINQSTLMGLKAAGLR